MFYHVLDIFFMVFHSALILFNVLGWIWKRTRQMNLITLLLTGSSWLIIGWIVGIPGYCPLTDWHFSVLEKLGRTGLPNSYIKYLADRITGLNFNPALVDNATLFVFLAVLVLSIALNMKYYIVKRKQKLSGTEKG